LDVEVEIISIGNELLIGKTLNSNANWLAKRISSLGLNINRITVVGDDVHRIAAVLKETITRNPKYIITTGGLGPTFDDKTFEGIAKAFDSTLNVDVKAMEMVRRKYYEYAKEMGREKFELTPARIKMAKIPEGSEPLPNPVGTAPAIKLCQRKLTVFALPGVPSEMKAIFEESLTPILKKAAGNLTFYESSLLVTGIMESEMAPFIDEVMHDNPYVYIKSHPMGVERKPQIELHLTTTATNRATVKNRISRALAQLTEIVQTKGGKIIHPNT
jgi:nicotinamide-nucleotide amidase